MTQKTATRKGPRPLDQVRNEADTLKLAVVGHALDLNIYRRGHLLGHLFVDREGLAWLRAGQHKTSRRIIPWRAFNEMIGEWPFGGQKRSRQKGDKPKESNREAPSAAGVSQPEPRPTEAGPIPIEPPKPLGILPVEIDGLQRAMHGLRKIFFQATERDGLWLVKKGDADKDAPIDVVLNDLNTGGIDVNNFYRPKPEHTRSTKRVIADLRRFLKDPEHWIEITGKKGICSRCGRQLTAEASVIRSMGAVCAKKFAQRALTVPDRQPRTSSPVESGPRIRSKADSSREPPPKPLGILPVEIDGLQRAMHGLRKIFFQATERDGLWLVKKGDADKDAPIDVVLNDLNTGGIDVNNFYRPKPEHTRSTKRVIADLRRFLKDPEHWIEITGKKGICSRCGRQLTAEASVIRSMGAVCAKKFAQRALAA